MICWVADRARAARNVGRVIVATDSQEIIDAVKSRNIEAIMTAADHTSGTDRIAEVIAGIPEAEIVVNVQGDEPMIAPETIERAVDVMAAEISKSNGAGIVTTWEPIESIDDLLNPNLVKVVVDDDENAVYFSRSPIPYPRDAVKRHGAPDAGAAQDASASLGCGDLSPLWSAFKNEPELLNEYRKHTGLYVYRRDVLLQFTKWPQSRLEQIEALEQLRALAHGVKIKVVQACATSTGVDTLEDLEKVRALVA